MWCKPHAMPLAPHKGSPVKPIEPASSKQKLQRHLQNPRVPGR
jgi:hypothetical protein